MRELRTQEGKKFKKFFEIVRAKAFEVGCIFLVDCGEGTDFENDDMEGENLSGWLIPMDKADRFQTDFDSNRVADEWDSFEVFMRWKNVDGKIEVEFEKW